MIWYIKYLSAYGIDYADSEGHEDGDSDEG